MRVGVQGHNYRGVPQELLHELGVDTPTQEQRGAGVTETVKPYLRQASLHQKWLEGTLDKVLWIERRTDTRGEDQAAVLI